jgi:hypothetical protein
MSAPTNLTAATAIDLGSTPFPITTSQRVDEAGTTYAVWYKYTAQPNDHVLGLWGFGDLTTYAPTLTLYTPPASAPVLFGPSALNVPLQFTVTPGVTYYFKFAPNAGNPSPATLAIRLVSANLLGAPAGSFLINDDTSAEHPTALLSSTHANFAFRYVNGVASSEQGDDNGHGGILYVDDNANVYKLYTDSFTTTQVIALDTDHGVVRAHLPTGDFYVTNGFTTGPVVTTISAAGVVGSTSWTLTGAAFLNALAPSWDATILYYGDRGVGSTDAIGRWDLVNDTALSALAAGITGYQIFDLYGLEDGSVLASYVKFGVSRDAQVLHYAANGTVLRTYALGSDFAATVQPRISLSPDGASVWVYQNLSSVAGQTTFRQFRISDGTLLATIPGTIFAAGVYDGAQTTAPTAAFGASGSCPLIVTKSLILAPALSPGGGGGQGAPVNIFNNTRLPIVRLRRAPHLNNERRRIRYHRFELELEGGTGTRTGQGADPQIMLRWTDDYGHAWSKEYVLASGRRGAWGTRVFAAGLGQSRDRCFEISQSDPVKTCWIGASLELTEDGR